MADLKRGLAGILMEDLVEAIARLKHWSKEGQIFSSELTYIKALLSTISSKKCSIKVSTLLNSKSLFIP